LAWYAKKRAMAIVAIARILRWRTRLPDIVLRADDEQNICMMTTEHDSDPPPKSHGLWSLMSKASDEPQPDADPPESVNESSTAPRSLFEVMRNARLEDTNASTRIESEIPPSITVAQERMATTDSDETVVPQQDAPSPFVFDGGRQRLRSTTKVSKGVCQPYFQIGFGLVSIALSTLALRPEIWMSLPAALLGFVTIFICCLTLFDSREGQASSIRWIPLIGILLGIAGIFLGPLYFSRLR
jgi:hypothetical protein